MTLPQNQKYSAGQIVDEHRTEPRNLIWPGVLTTWTVTVAAAVTGVYSYKVNGVLVSASVTVGPDDDNTTAQALQEKHIDQTESFRVSNATVAAAVATLSGRSVDDIFSVTDTVAAGGTLTAVDTTLATTDLPLGIGVAQSADGSMRRLAAGDTSASRVIGISASRAGSELKLNTGKAADEDVYEVGASADYAAKGEIPVQVEMDIAIGDPVFVRHTATGNEISGAFRNAIDGTDTVELDARWTEASYLDPNGVKVAILLINQP